MLETAIDLRLTRFATLELPPRVVDIPLGHRFDRSMASVYNRLSDADSQHFINQIPSGTYQPPKDDGESEG